MSALASPTPVPTGAVCKNVSSFLVSFGWFAPLSQKRCLRNHVSQQLCWPNLVFFEGFVDMFIRISSSVPRVCAPFSKALFVNSCRLRAPFYLTVEFLSTGLLPFPKSILIFKSSLVRRVRTLFSFFSTGLFAFLKIFVCQV